MLMLKNFSLAFLCAVMAFSCMEKQVLTVNVTDKVTNHDYLGNGAEWDPYDEAVSWGHDLSAADWDTLYTRVDRMRMGYVRCMINSPYLYWDAEKSVYDQDRNIDKLKKVLRYCQDNGITVVYGEFNPPAPSMKDSQEWVEMSVRYLDHLVNGLGFDCIRYFVIFNEPDGDWATTDGDIDLWLSMARRFDAQMALYPGLKDKVALAAPDAVVHWVHPDTGLTAKDWVARTAAEIGDIVGIYDVHAYPGQAEVRDGSYAARLRNIRDAVPSGKRIILGEAGFKYENPEDSLLFKETMSRADAHPYAGGADSNMMVYDHFYGLDMSLLAMDVMNCGYSGMAVWMLDDAGHSVGDTGQAENIKVWGFWNILGEEVFGRPEEESVRPWYHAWTLMCRYFPKGCDILSVEHEGTDGVRMCAAVKDGRYTFAVVNWSDKEQVFELNMPSSFENAVRYIYEDGGVRCVKENARTFAVPSQSLVVVTDMK